MHKFKARIHTIILILAVGVLVFLAQSCLATSGDLDRTATYQVEAGESVLALVPMAEAGTLDLPAALHNVGTAMVNAGNGAHQVAAERTASGKSALDALGPWGEPAAELLALVAGLYGLNRVRNGTRKKAIAKVQAA